MAEAREVQEHALTTIAVGSELLKAAKSSLNDAENMDLQEKHIRIAEIDLRQRRKYWADEMSKIQDGNLRRKRSQLEKDIRKIEERLTKKENNTEYMTGVVPVVPRNIGTPKPKEEQCP